MQPIDNPWWKKKSKIMGFVIVKENRHGDMRFAFNEFLSLLKNDVGGVKLQMK